MQVQFWLVFPAVLGGFRFRLINIIEPTVSYFCVSHFSCDRDETIRHYTYGISPVQRFSMQAFRFLSEHRFVYLHCDLVVCHRYDYNSTCAQSTSCSKRYRRGVDERSHDVSGMYPLSFGPVMKGEESADKTTGGTYITCLKILSLLYIRRLKNVVLPTLFTVVNKH